MWPFKKKEPEVEESLKPEFEPRKPLKRDKDGFPKKCPKEWSDFSEVCFDCVCERGRDKIVCPGKKEKISTGGTRGPQDV